MTVSNALTSTKGQWLNNTSLPVVIASFTSTNPGHTLPALPTGQYYTASIDWGDGTAPTAGVIDTTALTVKGNHVYKEALQFPGLTNNTYTITVTVGTNVTPGLASATGSVTVTDNLLNVQGGLEASAIRASRRRTASRTSINQVTAGRRNRFPR